ncbi:restriction endonuclease subunit S [Rothia aerolata]|uniref:Restriction endonuclease subunit S n=1 Tax=Rothia aerolata TaxID=1812262 RepID=A0A917MTT2_9MICC|nr:restriction endonuclease subunit S [Rothia aerolata]GGH63762.1 restriction endonuclease subunit S [Rothia aerolata]
MSRIAELIEELCPNGVMHLSMGATGTFTRGSGIQKKDFLEQGFPAIHYGQIFTRYGLWASETYIFVDEAVAGKSKLAQPGDVVIATTSENDEDLAKAVAWIGNSPVAVSSDAMIYSPENLNPKFVSYFLNSADFQKQKEKFITGTKVKRISSQNFSKIKIPVPPLKIQEEIVRILDRFTLLEAELEAELEARRKQYAYLSENIFSSIENGKNTSLGSIVSTVSTGATPRAGEKKYYENGEIPWLRTGEIQFRDIYCSKTKITQNAVNDYRLKMVPENSVVVAISGATAARSAVLKSKMVTNQHCCCLQVNPSIAYYKYVFYWLKKDYLVLKSKGRGARSDLNTKIIKEHPILLPPLDEQKRIADLLDKFDALVNDISSGLPAEIAARRKQYEYYRDQLLTFKELQPEAA